MWVKSIRFVLDGLSDESIVLKGLIELTCCSIFKVHYVVFDDLFIVLFREISVKYFFQKIWCLEAESNHRHGDFQSPALPTELSRLIFGGPSWTRTSDLTLIRRAL